MLTRLKLDNQRVITIVILMLIGVALTLKLVNVFNAPAHWDTGLYLNIAVGYLERGILTPLMWRYNPEWNIVTGSGSGYGVFLLIGWVKLFGISVLSGHLLMYLVGVVNLPVIYLLGKRFYNSHEAGLWVATFFALSGTFAQDFYVRMDAPNILVCSLILLLQLEAVRRNKWWLHAAVGVSLIAALEVHILAVIYVGAFGLYYVVNYLTILLKEKRLLLWSPAISFGIGLGLAAAIYYLHHIAPNPDIYFMIARHCDICTPFSPFKEVERWAWMINRQPILTFFMISIGVFTAIRRRSSADRDYLVLLTGAYIALLVLNPPVYEVYTGHLLPLLALGMGGLFALKKGLQSERAENQHSRLPGVRILAIIVCITGIIVLVRGTYFTYSRAYISPTIMYQGRWATAEEATKYEKAIDYIHENIPTNVVIVGYESYYLDLVEYHNFASHLGVDKLGLDLRNETYLDLWQREKPQVFIGDAQSDPDIEPYVTAQGDFVEVLPRLWVEKPLVARLASDTQQAN